MSVQDRTAGESHTPERIIQFGTGVFLLGFVDWIVEQLNRRSDFDAGIVAFKARPGSSVSLEPLNRHGGQFHVWLRGFEGGELVDRLDTIDCLNRAVNPFEDFAAVESLAASPDLRWLVSNTTEAGISYRPEVGGGQTVPTSFPGMLTALLYRRYQAFSGERGSGLAILCCELIEGNGDALQAIVTRHAREWGLGEGFLGWLDAENAFCNTLVDRIVTGTPGGSPPGAGLADDALVIEAEAFHAWVIEAPAWVRSGLPLEGAGLNVQFTDDLRPYRERKVRILNGAHTGCFAASLLLGVATVFATTEHELLSRYLRRLVIDEICPTLGGDQEAVRVYAEAILQRFRNPYVEHRWRSIALNAVSKWQARLLPTLRDASQQRGELPPLLVFSLAALLVLYREGGDAVQDDEALLAAMDSIWSRGDGSLAAVTAVLEHPAIWNDPPCQQVPGLAAGVAKCLGDIDNRGLEQTLESLLETR